MHSKCIDPAAMPGIGSHYLDLPLQASSSRAGRLGEPDQRDLPDARTSMAIGACTYCCFVRPSRSTRRRHGGSIASWACNYATIRGIAWSTPSSATTAAIASCAGLADSFEIDGVATYEGHTDQPPSPLAIEAAGRRGYALGDLKARPLATNDLAHFDYPLAMDRTHLAARRWLAPSGFTERPQMFMWYASARGGRDVQDPFGRTKEDFERALDLIEAGCAGLLRRLQTALIGARE